MVYKDKNERKEYDRKYREEHKERLKNIKKEYHQKNKDNPEFKFKKKAWKEQNPEKVKEYKKKWIEKHPNYMKEYHQKHKKRLNKLSKEYNRKYEEKCKICCKDCGKKILRKALRCRSCANKGEKNPMFGRKRELSPFWLGGKSFEPYGLEFNNKFKRAIRKRDNQICMLCKIHREKLKEAFSIHHINYDKKLSIPQNCISLCRKCHTQTNKDREIWTKHFQELLAKEHDYQYSETKEIILNLR